MPHDPPAKAWANQQALFRSTNQPGKMPAIGPFNRARASPLSLIGRRNREIDKATLMSRLRVDADQNRSVSRPRDCPDLIVGGAIWSRIARMRRSPRPLPHQKMPKSMIWSMTSIVLAAAFPTTRSTAASSIPSAIVEVPCTLMESISPRRLPRVDRCAHAAGWRAPSGDGAVMRKASPEHAVSDELGIDPRAAPLGMLVFLDEGRRALAHHGPVAVGVMRTRGAGWRSGWNVRQRAAGCGAGKREPVDRRVPPACHRRIGISSAIMRPASPIASVPSNTTSPPPNSAPSARTRSTHNRMRKIRDAAGIKNSGDSLRRPRFLHRIRALGNAADAANAQADHDAGWRTARRCRRLPARHRRAPRAPRTARTR